MMPCKIDHSRDFDRARLPASVFARRNDSGKLRGVRKASIAPLNTAPPGPSTSHKLAFRQLAEGTGAKLTDGVEEVSGEGVSTYAIHGALRSLARTVAHYDC